MNARRVALFVLLTSALVGSAGAKTLDIYFIDVEGGQSTLVVTPQRQSLLIDAGYGGNDARDAKRILAAAKDASIKRIDDLLITHFHDDHIGGVAELAQMLPMSNFFDHGEGSYNPDSNSADSVTAFDAYTKVRAKVRHVQPRPGDRIPLKGIDVTVVSSAEATLTKPMKQGGAVNAACTPASKAETFSVENRRSTGVVIQFGKFRFLDIGDLSGQPILNLVCPTNMIGPVDVYLVAHHGGADVALAETFAAFKPRIAMMNNGATKGGGLKMYQLLHQIPGLESVWQLHYSNAAREQNFAPEHIANLDESTGHWLKLSANEDGSFKIQNGRTGEWTSYPAR